MNTFKSRRYFSHLAYIACWFFVLVIGLTSCAQMPISSMYRLRNLDPTTTDIEYLKFAVRIPEKTKIPEDGVKLIIGTEHDNRVNLEETFVLTPVSDRSMLVKIERSGTTVLPYRVSSEDASRFIRIRQQIQYEKTQGADGRLEIRANVCHTEPELPSSIPLSTFINAVETNGYVPLIVDADLIRRANAEGMAESIKRCY